MAKMNGIENLSLKELMELYQQITATIAERKRSGLAETRARMADIAAESGFSLDDLFGKPDTRKGSRGSVPVKFRNPDDPAETWTGRGRQPRWLVAKLAKRGTSIESFRV